MYKVGLKLSNLFSIKSKKIIIILKKISVKLIDFIHFFYYSSSLMLAFYFFAEIIAEIQKRLISSKTGGFI